MPHNTTHARKRQHEREITHIKRHIMQRYILAIGLIFALITTSHLFLGKIIQTQTNAAPVINVSGRQRMLSQRIALYASTLMMTESSAQRQRIRSDLRDIINLMERSHEGLTQGNQDMNLPDIYSDAVRTMYFDAPMQLNTSVEEYLAKARVILLLPENELYVDHPTYAALLDAAPKMLRDLNAIVGQYERESRSEIMRLERMETIIYSVSVLLLLLEAIFIFQPLTRQVANAYRRAQRASEAKSEFLASMSHEIRTPMNSVIGLSELMLHENRLPEKEAERTRIILESSELLLGIIDDILDFSKIEAGKMTLSEQSSDIRDLIHDVVAMMQPRADRASIELRCEYDEQLPEYVMIDPVRVQQIIVNLIANAIKFTSQGHVNLCVASIAQKSETLSLSIAVSDTGIGIAPEKLSYIFERFTQAENGTNRAYGGSGLGLTICQHLATLMGGHIKVSSQPGKGSEFTLYLDVAIDRYASKAPDTTHHSPSLLPLHAASSSQKLPADTNGNYLKGKTILLVEDNASNALLAIDILKAHHMKVVHVNAGGEAIEVMRDRQDIDAIIMDCHMPDIDGYSATRSIRNLPKQFAKRTPIIALTSHVAESNRAQCIYAGMDDYLEKPLRRKELLTRLEHWIQQSVEVV